MSVKSFNQDFNYLSLLRDSKIDEMSDDEFISIIIGHLELSAYRKMILVRQLKIYFTKIRSQLKMRVELINKIVELIQYETKLIQNKRKGVKIE